MNSQSKTFCLIDPKKSSTLTKEVATLALNDHLAWLPGRLTGRFATQKMKAEARDEPNKPNRTSPPGMGESQSIGTTSRATGADVLYASDATQKVIEGVGQSVVAMQASMAFPAPHSATAGLWQRGRAGHRPSARGHPLGQPAPAEG